MPFRAALEDADPSKRCLAFYSGILQGKFVKRHGAPKSDDSGNYHWKDLAVQTNVEMYGKVFRIVDADEFTRAFYQDQGV